MKHLFFFLISILFSLSSIAQDNLCESSYMPFKEGVNLEYTNYNSKGKETGRQQQTVSSLTATDGGFKATIEFSTSDGKEKNDQRIGSFDIECQGGTVKMDMSNILDPAVLESFSQLEAEITGEDIQFPNDPQPGQELPDGNMEIKASMGGLVAMSTKVQMTDRKVDGFEEVTTPAGTFNCVKISQNTNVKVMGMNRSSKSTNWLAKGIGTVKTENYNAKGKLESSMVLTKKE